MSDPFAITDEEAEGLARLAQAQLRLALRLSERAIEEPDADTAGRLARASERVARGYRQSLLLKSRLKRDRETAEREAAADPRPRTPQEQARINQRVRDVHASVERIIVEQADEIDAGDARAILVFVMDALEEEARYDGFLSEPVEAQVERMCQLFDLMPPVASAAAAADTS